MTQGQDLNPQGSQSVPATNAAPEPNPAGKSAEPTSDPSSRMKEWEAANNNKSQQLAAERRALENERAALQRERQTYPQGYPQGQPQPGQYAPPPYGQPQGQQSPQFMPANFQALVDEFGFKAASEMVAAQNQQAGLVLSQVQPLVQRLQANEYQQAVNGIDAKGERLYGKEYQDNRQEIFNLIANGDPARGIPQGCTVEYAMFMIRGGEEGLKQRLTDQVYQKQEQKQDGNTAQQGAGPSTSSAPQVSGIEAATIAAMKELGMM